MGQSREDTGLWQSLIVDLLSQPEAHGCDERCPFAAAVLRQQEVDMAVRGQFLDGFVHDPGEAVQKR